MTKIDIFTAEARGVGRKDYSRAIERSTQPFITPTLRQDRLAAFGDFLVPATAFPWGWSALITQPQDDGTWDWIASSIICHYFEIAVSIEQNSLCFIFFENFASLADYYAGIREMYTPQVFGYGKAKIRLSVGFPTHQGGLYQFVFGAWPEVASYRITVSVTGIASELTSPWMG